MLAICCTSLLIIGMDATIVNVALPSIQSDLGASVSGLQWAVASYTMVLASLLILSGSMADRIGRVRVFQCGLVVFTAASVGCSLAPTIGWLIAFRVLQGVGASMLNPVAMSIIRNTFVDPRERAQAIGIWGAVFGLSMALGPVLGGVLTELSWRAVFLINVPIGLAAILLTAIFVPESRAPSARRIDPVGQALAFLLLASLTWTLIEGSNLGWGSSWIVAGGAVATLSLVGFVRHELRRDEPLVELRFFGSRPFTGATAIAVLSFAAFAGFLFVNTLYLQEARGLSSADAGFCVLPMALATMLLSPISGRVIGVRGVRWPLVLGGVGIGVGSLMLVRLSPDTSLVWLLAAYTVFGAGFGAINPPITNTAVSGMPASQAAVAAAVASTSRMIGQTLGVAVIGGIATAGLADPIGEQLAGSSHPAWWLLAGLACCMILLGLWSSTTAAKASASRTARRLEPEPQGLAEPR
ncbi:MAG: MFS transporter [Solirubrobacterales bacterium]|nr:MFS transporter [Solirubrobacterales bacterium]